MVDASHFIILLTMALLVLVDDLLNSIYASEWQFILNRE